MAAATGAMSPEDQTFPERLVDAGDAARVVETTGLGGLLVAAPLGGYAGYALASTWRTALTGAEIGVLIALLVGAAAGVGYEVHRWRRRSVLVVRGGAVGIYNDGALEAVLGTKDFLTTRGTQVSPHRVLLMLAALSGLFLLYGLSQEGGVGARIVGCLPGVYLALLTLSFARSGLRCSYFHLSGRKIKVLFERSRLAAAGIR